MKIEAELREMLGNVRGGLMEPTPVGEWTAATVMNLSRVADVDFVVKLVNNAPALLAVVDEARFVLDHPGGRQRDLGWAFSELDR